MGVRRHSTTISLDILDRIENPFVRSIMEIIHKNIHDPHFHVEALSAKAFM